MSVLWSVLAVIGTVLLFLLKGVGILLLVVLVCVGVPLKYLAHSDTVVTWTGVPHGWLYMILLITAYDLGRRVNRPWLRLILIALAGTVPART